MSNIDIVDRSKILGKESFEFDKVIRGYDPKQVDEYINNLIVSQKNATEVFDTRFSDLKNDNEMLRFELEEARKKLENAKEEYSRLQYVLEGVREERDKYKLKAETERKVVIPDNSQEIAELNEKVNKALTKNRLLQDENRKLVDQNRDLQRDVAHLTKKVDRNRSKINDLTGQVESGMPDGSEKKYSEITKIYESAIDRVEDLVHRIETEFSLAHSKAEDLSDNK